MFGAKSKMYQRIIDTLQNELADKNKLLLTTLQDKNKMFDAIEAIIKECVPEDQRQKAWDMVSNFKPKEEKKEEAQLSRRVIAWKVREEYMDDFPGSIESLGRDCFLKNCKAEFVRYTNEDEDIALYKIMIEGKDNQLDYFATQLAKLWD